MLESMHMLGEIRTLFVSFGKLRGGRDLSACHAYGAENGRWKRRRCFERSGKMLPVHEVAWTQATEGGEPPRSKGGGAGGWQTAWSLVEETRTMWGGEFE